MGDDIPGPLLPGAEQYVIKFLDAGGAWLFSVVYQELTAFQELGASYDYMLSVDSQAPIDSPYRAIRALSFSSIMPQPDASWESHLGLVQPNQARDEIWLDVCDGHYTLHLEPDLRARHEQATRFQLVFLMERVAVDPDRKSVYVATRDRAFAVGPTQPIGELGDLPVHLLRDESIRRRRYARLLGEVKAAVREEGDVFWIGKRCP